MLRIEQLEQRVMLTAYVAGQVGDNFLQLGPTGYAYRSDATTADLDYSTDFSVETVVRSTPYVPFGRWGGFVTKGPTDVLYGKADGWGMGIASGSKEVYALGNSIQAQVGDGINVATVRSPQYDGDLYAVMTWDVSESELSLFVNGQLVGTDVDTSIVDKAIDNTNDLQLGKTLSVLKQPIFMARLWNRELTRGEVGALWSDWDQSDANGRHILPPDFSRADLVSEWLMDAESDVDGNIGTTHVRDNVGSNHMQMTGGADVRLAEGSLALSYPANFATDVEKSVTLTATGGRSNINNPVGPLSYYFQVDTVETFDSGQLKESGWISHYGEFKPGLAPSTTYYWRVRTRDTALVPNETSYTPAQSFTTEDAETWYVRPAGGSYGTSDGTSYANAWNGFENIKFGIDGVEAGDTLYISGDHQREMHSTDFYGGQIRIAENGYDAEHPITIRMDASGVDQSYEDGLVWGAFKDFRPEENEWEAYDAENFSGVYYIENAKIRYFSDGLFEDIDGIEDLDMQKQTSIADVSSTPSSFFRDESFTYVKLHDGSDPSAGGGNKVMESQFGYYFHLDRASHITFLNCDFRAFQRQNHDTTTITDIPRAHHITWDSSTFKYSTGFIFPTVGNDYWTIRNSSFEHAGNGVYAVAERGSSLGANFFTVQNSTFKHIGRFQHYHDDAHGIGIQGGHGHLIEGNYFENSGSAVTLYNFPNMEMKDHTVRYNFAYDMNNRDGAGGNGRGYELNGNNGLGSGLATGNKYYYNIAIDVQGSPSRETRDDPVMFWNNSYYNFGDAHASAGFGSQFYNNGLAEATGIVLYINWLIDGGTEDDFFVDTNGYSPSIHVGDRIHAIEAEPRATIIQTFAEYLTRYSTVYDYDWDLNSVTTDPKFDVKGGTIDAAEDLELQWDSPWIDAGTPIAFTKDLGDFNRNPIYGRPDIGALEYQPPYTIGTDELKVGTNVRVYADGKYRQMEAAGENTAALSFTPPGGWDSFGDTEARDVWADIEVDSWGTSGSYYRKWRLTNADWANHSTDHTVAGLEANTVYSFTVGGVLEGTYTSDGSGVLTTTYTGSNYDDLAFELQKALLVETETVSISESPPAGLLVAAVNTVNDESKQSLTYAISSGNEDNAFSIDPATGEVTIATPALIDYESQSRRQLAISITDAETPIRVGTGVLTIEIENVNEAPVVATPYSDRSVSARTPFEFALAAFGFADQEGHEPIMSIRQADGSQMPDWMSFDAQSLTLSGLAGDQDAGDYTIEVTAADSLDPLLTASQSFQLTIVRNPFPWHNPIIATDVDRNGVTTALDALVIIYHFGNGVADDRGFLPVNYPGDAPYLDPFADGRLTALDALLVIRQLIRQHRVLPEAEHSARFELSQRHSLQDEDQRNRMIDMTLKELF